MFTAESPRKTHEKICTTESPRKAHEKMHTLVGSVIKYLESAVKTVFEVKVVSRN